MDLSGRVRSQPATICPLCPGGSASGTRIKLGLLLVYLLLPLDLVPDFLSGIGHANDVIIVALVLRSMIRSTGPNPCAGIGRVLLQGWRLSNDSRV